MGSIDYKKLYELQDKVLKVVFETEWSGNLNSYKEFSTTPEGRGLMSHHKGI